MEILDRMLKSLSPVEEKHFQKYLLFRNPDKHALENRLFLALSAETDIVNQTKTVIKKVYQCRSEAEIAKNTDAYHKLRMRLTDKVEDFILTERTGTNIGIIEVVKYLFVARFYFLKGQYVVAWRYAEKAEQSAIDAEQYDLLNRVYYTQIEFAHTRNTPDNSDIIKKWQQNKLKAEQDAALNAALSTIRSKIATAKESGDDLDVDLLSKEIFTEFRISKSLTNTVPFRHKLAMIVWAILEKKGKHRELERYFLNTYAFLETNKLFKPRYFKEKTELLTNIIICQVRNLHIDDALAHIDILEQESQVDAEYSTLSVKVAFQKYVTYVCCGELEKAGDVLRTLEKKYKTSLNTEDHYFFTRFHSNYISYHYFRGDTRQALQQLNILLNEEKRSLKADGINGVIYKNILRVALTIGMGTGEHIDMAERQLRSLQRRFKSNLANPELANWLGFIQILQQIIAESGDINKETLQHIRAYIDSHRYIIGTSEVIPSVVWLKAYAYKQDPYPLMLEEISRSAT